MGSECLGMKIFINFYTSVCGVRKNAPGESDVPHNTHMSTLVEDFPSTPMDPQTGGPLQSPGELYKVQRSGSTSGNPDWLALVQPGHGHI